MSIKVMAKVWEWSQAESASLLLMLALADHADDDGLCYPGVERLARKCRISPRSVQRHLKELEGIGEIRVDVGRGVTVQGGATNRYRITVNASGQPRTQSGVNLTGGDKPGLEVVTNRAGSGDIALSPESSVEPSERTVIPLTPGGGEASSIQSKMNLLDGFAEFWAEYPRKVKKDKALAAWKRKRCAAIREEIMLALAMQKTWPQWLKKAGQFIPHPTTWLNGGEWQNEGHTVDQPKAKEKRGF